MGTLTASRGYPQLAANGCTEYVTQWSDGSYTWVPFDCPPGVVYVKPGQVAPPNRPIQPSQPSPPAPSPGSTFGPGVKIVGQDIQPGTYRAPGGRGCYWERLKGFSGSLDDIIANELATGPTVATIAPGDAGFNSRACGQWTSNLAPITSSPTAPFGEGTYIVGTDIAPGTWRSAGGSSCYYARLKGFTGRLDDIIANDLGSTTPVVSIAASDRGFTSHGCGAWNKIG